MRVQLEVRRVQLQVGSWHVRDHEAGQVDFVQGVEVGVKIVFKQTDSPA